MKNSMLRKQFIKEYEEKYPDKAPPECHLPGNRNYTYWLENKIIDAKDFELIARQILKYLNENHHPHTILHSDGRGVEILEGVKIFHSDDYIVD